MCVFVGMFVFSNSHMFKSDWGCCAFNSWSHVSREVSVWTWMSMMRDWDIWVYLATQSGWLQQQYHCMSITKVTYESNLSLQCDVRWVSVMSDLQLIDELMIDSCCLSLQDQWTAGGFPVQVPQHELHQISRQRQRTVRESLYHSRFLPFIWSFFHSHILVVVCPYCSSEVYRIRPVQ